ncbi:MAG: ArsB/NhaD family transporter [Vulcanimicrobiaceae bacterium]
MGTIVTTLLSNDATAVVLTPAVFAALARTDANPMPFLYICAFIANAASFVLPISNPANLVVFDGRFPLLAPWLAAFALPSLIAIAGTFLALYAVTRADLRVRFRELGTETVLSPGGRVALGAILASAGVLVFVAAIGKPIGITTFALGIFSTAAVACVQPKAPRAVARHVSWSVIPLVAGLFVIVQALDSSGVLALARAFLRNADALPTFMGNLFAGSMVTVACTLLNNLPVALISGFALQSTNVAPHLAHATLVAADLGPNLSVTGSLATLLWLIALRRDGFEITPWQFMRMGLVVLVPTLALSLLVVR